MAGLVTIFLGAPGAGKSLQARIISDLEGMIHLSTGVMLRASNDPAVIDEMEEGKLVDSDTVNQLLASHLEALPAGSHVILDGYPRMLGEAHWLTGELAKLGWELHQVIYFHIDKVQSEARSYSRGREDDTFGVLEERWRQFSTESLPVIEYYQGLGKVRQIDAGKSVEAVTAELRELL